MIMDTKARLGGCVLPVLLGFDQVTAPDVISFEFSTRNRVRWLIGRDLLTDGLMRDVGDGDLRIGPSPATDEVAFRYDLRGGRAIIRFPWNPVAGFVRATYDKVPRGTEYDGLDWDQLLPTAGGAS